MPMPTRSFRSTMELTSLPQTVCGQREVPRALKRRAARYGVDTGRYLRRYDSRLVPASYPKPPGGGSTGGECFPWSLFR